MSYYNLSGEESADESDDSENEEDLPSNTNSGLWDRIIVHVDVDCFYCQCEEVDGPAEYKERPIAIGQKHIIVTSNYIARQYGVKKLQSRDAAYVACPNLLILEGSDLEHYRKHSRNIYLAFRDALKRHAKDWNANIQVRRGGMDENFADITDLILHCQRLERPSNSFIYGENVSAQSSIVEDQSGAEVVVQHLGYTSPSDNVHVSYVGNRKHCQQRLHTAASLCEEVRKEIKEKTGFTVTMGISVSRMLAKLTSDLKKPNSLNVLYPWRSGTILLPMPLRKIPELGHSTLRLLKECLKGYHKTERAFWTCQDLLQVPLDKIKASLISIKPTEESSYDHCMMLLDKCRGLDKTLIEDDNGGLTKQVSVEDSFRRGTMTTKEAVWRAMDELFVRLPKLLEQRRLSSPNASKAYATTIRLTARVVDTKLTTRRRPFKTHSKQCPFDGKNYMMLKDEERRDMLAKLISPLLQKLVLANSDVPEINVTRLNIAATNFQDLVVEYNNNPTIATFAFPGVKLNQSMSSLTPTRERHAAANSHDSLLSFQDQIDPNFLAELPPDIAAEVKQMCHKHHSEGRKRKSSTIDTFFQPKKKNH